MVPVVYLFYPETADRALEDMERFFRENHDIFVFKYKDGTSVKRPQTYVVDAESRIQESKAKKGSKAGDKGHHAPPKTEAKAVAKPAAAKTQARPQPKLAPAKAKKKK